MNTEFVLAGDNPEKFTENHIGNKAKSLLWLYQQQNDQFSVPEFFITPTVFWREYVQQEEIDNYLTQLTSKKLNKSLKKDVLGSWASTVPSEILKLFSEYQFSFGIQDKLSDFRFNKSPITKRSIKQLIHRSSSPLESSEHGYDGVFASMRDGAGFSEEMNYVAASAFTPHAHFWMEEYGDTNKSVAVITQEYVDGKYHGHLLLNDHRTLELLGNKDYGIIDIDKNSCYPPGFPLQALSKLLNAGEYLQNKTKTSIELEFAIHNKHPYILQLREKPERPKPKAKLPEKSELITSKLIGRQVGRWEGSAINLLETKLEQVQLTTIDAQHPDGIYFLDYNQMHQENFQSVVDYMKQFDMKTSKKIGVILCGRPRGLGHMYEIYTENMQLLALTKDTESLRSIATGTRLHIQKESPTKGSIYKLLD